MELKHLDKFNLGRNAWLKLMAESETATVFQHPAWLRVWQRYFGSGLARTSVVGVFDKGELVGVGAFEILERKVRFLGMREIGGQELTDFGDIVAKKGYELAVWREMLARFQVPRPKGQAKRRAGGQANSKFQIVLDYVRGESPSFEVVARAAESLGMRLTREEQEVAPFIKLPGTWGEYLEGLERKKRHELRRKMRRVRERLGYELVVSEEAGGELEERLIELIGVSSAEKAEFMDQEMSRFFKAMIGGAFRYNLGVILALKASGGYVAAVWGFKFGESLYLYNGGFDPRQGSGLGIALSGEVVAWAIKRKYRLVDFLRGGERYKYDLGAEDQQLWRLTLEA